MILIIILLIVNMIFIIIQASYINELEEIIDELNEGVERHE